MTTNLHTEEGRYDLENSLGYVLNRAANIVAAKFGGVIKSHNLNLQTWRILATLSEFDNQSVSALADHTGAELSYLSRSVAAMEEDGLVERKQSASDKRASQLSLTTTGRALVRKLAPQGRAIETVCLVGVSDAHIEATLHTLRLVYRNLVESQAASADINRKLTVAGRVNKRKQVESKEAGLPRRSTK